MMSGLTPVPMRDNEATCNRFVSDHERCGKKGVVAFLLEGQSHQEVRCPEHDPRSDAAKKEAGR